MRLRVPLYAKLLGWLFLNLFLIGALLIAFPGRSGIGWNLMLSQPVRDRLVTIGDTLAREVMAAQPEASSAILDRYYGQYGVRFSLGPPDGLRPHGPPSGENMQGPPPEGPRFFGPGPPPLLERDERIRQVSIRHHSPLGPFEVLIPAIAPGSGDIRPVEVRARATGLRSLLVFLGIADQVLFVVLVVALSAALWWPFVFALTRTLVRITEATRSIAEGRFEVRVQTRRRDELGRLAESVNAMAVRLGALVGGQRQFLADVAHEVASPLGRMQIGLGLLESRLGAAGGRELVDIQDDARQMAQLLEELLMFSRTGPDLGRAEPGPVDLAATVAAALAQEAARERVHVEVAPGTLVLGHAALLARALANLLRNALRYVPEAAGPIEVIAASEGGKVLLRVADHGPGVAPDILPRLGEPLFRAEASRNREAGGFGLGLAIVRRCVESCGGSVTFRNREGGGFEALLTLAAAGPAIGPA